MQRRQIVEFDYIVVGGGSAGCVLARRLAEDGMHTVLLLEAGGGDRRLRLQVPIGYGQSFYDARVNWMYRTEPDPMLDDRCGYWPRGRVLGGSSSINAMVHIRGFPGDFDDWRAEGNPGWGWRDVLPFFMRAETYGPGGNAVRGGAGPLRVSEVSRECHPLCETFLRACEEAGLPRNADLNGADPEGVGYYQMTVWNGLRMSASRAYLRPVLALSNLRVELHAQALHILIEGPRAVGVVFLQGGERRTVRARRDVLVAAGAINTPQLLQLSGIGPAAVLACHGIRVVADLSAVGRHLQDHLCIDHLYRSRRPTLNEDLGRLTGQARAALRYALFRRGPLALSVNQAGGFVRTGPDLKRPDLQLYFSPLSYTRAPPGRRALMRPDPFPGFLLSAQPCRPASRGHVVICSADPLAPPKIVANSLAVESDLENLLRGSEFLRRLAAAPALAAVIAEEIHPGPDVRTRHDLLTDIRRRASTVFHPVGTCRMGPDSASSVVDHQLRVHGVQGLRIVDASVFPAVTSGNTNAPTIMVAEKAAAMVLEAARRSPAGTG